MKSDSFCISYLENVTQGIKNYYIIGVSLKMNLKHKLKVKNINGKAMAGLCSKHSNRNRTYFMH